MKTVGWVLIVLAVATLLAIGGYWFYKNYWTKTEEGGAEVTRTAESKAGTPASIPESTLKNKFGFLSAGPDDVDFISSVSAGWVRPHPGPFVWDAMQASKDSDVSFKQTDEIVKRYQDGKVAILATIFPFAEWDQSARSDASKCKVSGDDEFLPKNDKKGRDSYLPESRCNPNDWDLYRKWVATIVERYDGDGNNDMPGLTMPIKYWEVMNEPDLDESDRLDFYKEDAASYSKLLINTSQVVHQTDTEAKVLIAGAAGGSSQFLNFYKKVLKDKNAQAAFDIGNVHCISNDSYDSFNVEPYKAMLEGLGLDKPIWVTEADAMIHGDADKDATQTLVSSRTALELGAQRLFFTRYDFTSVGPGGVAPPKPAESEISVEISGKDPVAAYKKITAL